MKRLAHALFVVALLAPRSGRGLPPTSAPQQADDLDRAYRAAGDDPRARSVRAGDPELPAITLDRYQLPNGLDVVLSPGGSTSLVDVRVTYAVGTQDAPPGRPELAHMVEHLSSNPTRRVPEGLLSVAESLGTVALWAETGLHETQFGLEAPGEALERALWIEGERMASALDEVDAAALAREWRVLRREASTRSQGEAAGAVQAISAAAVAAGRPPFASDRTGTCGSPAEVREFARRWYAPANARLTVVGRFSPPQVRAWIARYFGSIERDPAPVRARDAPTAPLDGPRVIRARTSHPLGLEQVAVAWPVPPPDEPGGVELDLLGRCLAAANVWEALTRAGIAERVQLDQTRPLSRHQLLYSPSYFPAALMLRVDVISGRTTGEALAVLDESLARYRDELGRTGCDERVVSGHAWGLVDAADDLAERAARIARWPDPADPGAFRRHLARVRAFRGDALRELAGRWFAPDRRFVAHLTVAPPAAPGRTP